MLEQLPMIVYILQKVAPPACAHLVIVSPLDFNIGALQAFSGAVPHLSPSHHPAKGDGQCCSEFQIEQLNVVPQADEELAQYIIKAGILPYFALSWYITWFAHDVQSLPQIARLFDLFMASHPLMPLYVGTVAMKVGLSYLNPQRHEGGVLTFLCQPLVHPCCRGAQNIGLSTGISYLQRQRLPFQSATSRNLCCSAWAGVAGQAAGGERRRRRGDPLGAVQAVHPGCAFHGRVGGAGRGAVQALPARAAHALRPLPAAVVRPRHSVLLCPFLLSPDTTSIQPLLAVSLDRSGSVMRPAEYGWLPVIQVFTRS